MRAVGTIAWREIRSIFYSPIAYVVICVWLFLSGLSFYALAVYFAQPEGVSRSATDNPLTAFFGGTSLFYMVLLVFVPVMTMRLIAEEKRTGTIETLLTAPVTEVSVVLGKYLAGMTFWVAMWFPTLMYVWITSSYGDVDMGVVGGAYLGAILIGVYYIAIGTLMSAVSPNQIVAAILTFMAIGTLFLMGLFSFIFQDESSQALFGYFSVWNHMEQFAKGVIDSRPLVFDLSLAALALGVAIVVLRSRRTRGRNEALGGVLGLVLIFGIAGMLNYLSFRHYTKWDWTSQGLYTLSGRTEAVLREVNRDVKVYVFLGAGEPSFGELKELIERYRAAQNRISVRYVDPDREPSEYQVLAQRFNLRTAMLEGGGAMSDVAAVVVAGDRQWKIERSDLLGLDFGSLDDEDGPELDVKSEQALTGAIVQVLRGRATKVCATRGHGEWSVDPGERSLQPFAEELKRDNVEMEAVETLGSQRIPRDCDALFVVGPVTPFNDTEARLIESYVRGGGNLLVAVDPLIERDAVQPTGLEEMLRRLGAVVGANVVLELDEARLLTPSPVEAFFADDYGESEHDSVRALAAVRARTVLHLVRSVTPESGGSATSILRASAESYAETDLSQLGEGSDLAPGEGDARGPISLAVAVRVRTEGARPEPQADEDDHGHGEEDDEPGGRVIVIGDADFLQGELLQQPAFANYDLASAFTGWLAERESLISIAPKRIDAQAIVMSEEDLSALLIKVLLLLPLSVILLGFAVWWMRRS